MKKVNDNAKMSSSAKAKASKKTADPGSKVEGAADIGVESVTSLQEDAQPSAPEASVQSKAEAKPRARRTRSRTTETASNLVSSADSKVAEIQRPLVEEDTQAAVEPSAEPEVDVYSAAVQSPFDRDQLVNPSESARYLPNRSPSVPTYQFGPQSNDRIAIFIDGSNLFYAASHLNIEVDYRRLLTTLVRGRRLLRAYFYTGVDPQNEKQRGFLLWLNRHGHRVVSKELAHLPDGSRKANMHVEMAVDMMRIAEYCSTLTLLGGDGNLAYALQVLSQRGTSIEVVSLQSMTSDSLIDLADSYTDLADLRDQIKR